MREGHPPKKWQNLVYLACPMCSSPLEPMPYRETILRCMRDDECDFVIARATVLTILTDETHVLRQHLTAEDELRLENTVKAMREGLGEIEQHINH